MNITKVSNKWVLMSTVCVVGIIIGLLISVNMNFLPVAKSTAEPNVPVSNDIGISLSKSFTKVAKTVTPSVVTITSTKIIKTQKRKYASPFEELFGQEFGGEDFFKNLQPDTPEKYKSQGLGSGVIVKDDGTILTNNHVVNGADEIKVTLSDRRSFPAKIVGTDPKTDVAVIRLTKKADNLKAAMLGDSDKLEVGEWVLAIGNPFGLNSTVTSGIISAEGRGNVGVADFEDFIQTDAAINPGNSGGALVNLSGQVIGINTAIASKSGGYMGVGFAIPINMAEKVMNSLILTGKVVRGYLGVRIQDMTEEFSKNMKIKEGQNGILVGEVTKDSPADKAGIKPYDLIIKLNGKEIMDVNHFRNTIATTGPNTEVSITVLRDGRTMDLTAKLGELKGDEKSNPVSPKEDVQPTNLGFKVQPLTSDIAKQLNLPSSTQGIIVTDVAQGSSAMESGLSRGDVIKDVNRQPVKNMNDFKSATSKLKKGDSIMIQVQRADASALLAFTID